MASASTNTDRQRARLLGFAHVFLGILLMYLLFKVWPKVPWPSGDNKLPEVLSIKFWRWEILTTLDERLILLVIVAGGLGSFVHASTSFADYVGNDRFGRTWTWWYLLRPFIGVSLALVFYFVLRGGFLTSTGGADNINPYGIAALAGLVGMFSKQATDKLNEVFTTLFKPADGKGDAQRKDSLQDEAANKIPTISKIDVIAGSGETTVAITGTNFAEKAEVKLNDEALEITSRSATELVARLKPEHIITADAMTLTVINPPPGGSSAPMNFLVREP